MVNPWVSNAMVAADSNQMVPLEESCKADEPKILLVVKDETTNDWQNARSVINLPESTIVEQLINEVAKQFHYAASSFRLTWESMIGQEVDLTDGPHDEKNLGEMGFYHGKKNTLCVRDKDGLQPTRMDGTIGYVGLVNQAMTCYLNSLLQTLFMTPEFRNAVYRWDYDGSMEEESLTKSIPFQLQRLFLALQTSRKRAVETTDITKSFGWDSSEAWQQHDIQELCRVMFDALETKWRKTDQKDLINQLYQGKMKDYVKCLECSYESARMDSFLDIPLTVRPFGSTTSYGSVEEALEAFVAAETLDGNNQYHCERCQKKCDARKGLKFEHFPYILTMQMKRFDFDYNTLQRIKLNERMTFPEVLNLNRFISDDESLWKTNHDHDNEDGIPRGWGNKAACNKQEAPVEAEVPQVSENQSAPPPAPPLPAGGLSVPGGGFRHASAKKSNKGCGSPPGDEDEGIDVELASTNSSGASSSTSSASSASSSSSCNNDLEAGPYVYELFSIMIHSGSANGGHYYAYIKSFADNQWYSFNDQHVQRITQEDIFKTFGGGNGIGGRNYYYQSSVNAYMLMYRQVQHSLNASFMTVDTFPPHIKNILQRERDREEAEQRQREMDRCTCKIKLFCLKPHSKTLTEFRFEIHKDKTLKEATREAYALCSLEDEDVAFENVRLVKYDEYHDAFERSYNVSESNETMETILGGVKSSYMFDLLLEIKPSYATFQTYKPGGTTVKVHLVDLGEEVVHPSVNVRAQLSNTVEEFKALVAQALNLKYVGESIDSKGVHQGDGDFNSVQDSKDEGRMEEEGKFPKVSREILRCIHCVFERYHNDLRYMGNPAKSLKSEGFFRSNKVYVACEGETSDLFKVLESKRGSEVEELFKTTKFYSLLDRHNHTIRIQVTLPPQAPNPPRGFHKRVGSGGNATTGPSAPSSVLSAAPSCESGYATSTSISTTLQSQLKQKNVVSGVASDEQMDTSSSPNDVSYRPCQTDQSTVSVNYQNDASPTSIRRHSRREGITPAFGAQDAARSSRGEGSGSGTPSTSSSTRTIVADEPNGAALPKGRDSAQVELPSPSSPQSSLPNSPGTGTVSPLLTSPGGDYDGHLEPPPAGVSVVGGGKGWAFPEAEDALDDCMLPESASGRVSPAGDPSEEEDADNSPDNSQANAKLESWRTEMSRNWIREMNSRQMLRNVNSDEEGGGDSDKETQIGTWENKDVEFEELRDQSMGKFSSVENLTDGTDGTELWTDSGMVGGTTDWNLKAGSTSPEMMATSPPATSGLSCDSAATAVAYEPLATNHYRPGAPVAYDPVAGTTKMEEDHDSNFLNDKKKEVESMSSLATAPNVEELTDEDANRFFKATHLKHLNKEERGSGDGAGAAVASTSSPQHNVLSVEVDKRITLGSFKKKLEPWLGTCTDNFKVFRVYPNQQEFESTRLQETLTAFGDDGKMIIKYGRALRKGEYRVKVFHLNLEEPNETPKLLCETVFAKEMTVLEAKKIVLSELAASEHHADLAALSVDQVRLRKRAWKNPGTIYLDNKAFDTDIPIFANWEVFFQALKEPETLTQMNFVGVFLRRWRPADFKLDPFQEVVLLQSTVDELKSAISSVSGIPIESISYAKGRGTFPCDVSLLDIDTDLEWDPSNVTCLNVWPLYICDDGNVIFYRDKREKLKELDEEQKSALQQQDTARSNRSGTQVTFSPRKERPLRIKVYSESDDAPPISATVSNAGRIEEDSSVETFCDKPSSKKKSCPSPVSSPAIFGANDID